MAALQSLVLLIFAVTVQNLYLHMLALPETIGEMIKGWNRRVTRRRYQDNTLHKEATYLIQSSLV